MLVQIQPHELMLFKLKGIQMTERRSSILNLDSEAIRLARLMVKTSELDVSVIEALIESHDKLTQAVLFMRNNAEIVLGVPTSVYALADSVKAANKVLGDRREERLPVRMRKEIDIDEGLNHQVKLHE